MGRAVGQKGRGGASLGAWLWAGLRGRGWGGECGVGLWEGAVGEGAGRRGWGVAGAHLPEDSAPGVRRSWGGTRAVSGKEQDGAGGNVAEEVLCQEQVGPWRCRRGRCTGFWGTLGKRSLGQSTGLSVGPWG